MKTETEKAKENIKSLKEVRNTRIEWEKAGELMVREHKQACQRWLKWIKEAIGFENEQEAISRGYEEHVEKIQDLKTAIKLYEEEGI